MHLSNNNHYPIYPTKSRGFGRAEVTLIPSRHQLTVAVAESWCLPRYVMVVHDMMQLSYPFYHLPLSQTSYEKLTTSCPLSTNLLDLYLSLYCIPADGASLLNS